MRGDFIYAHTRMAESRKDEYDASDLLTRPPQGAPPPLSLHFEGNRIWLPDLEHQPATCQSAPVLAREREQLRLWPHSLYPWCAPRRGLEGICEVLRFPCDFTVPKLHDADGVRRLAVVGQDVFSNPKVATPDDPLGSKALPIGLKRAGRLYVVSAANAFGRLRILQDCVFVVDAVLHFEVPSIGRGPVLSQRFTDLVIVHFNMAPSSETKDVSLGAEQKGYSRRNAGFIAAGVRG